MTAAEKEKRIREALERYRAQIAEIRKEYKKEIEGILAGIRQEKLAELQRKLNFKE